MKSNEWVKTILYTYNYLGRVADGIDKLVTQNALNSFYFRGERQSENGVMSVANRIIELSSRKVRLINLKVLIEKSLNLMPRELARLLVQRYIDNDEAGEIALRNKLNLRTYFRKLIKAESSFKEIMTKLGFNDEKLSKYHEKEKWIIEVYEKFLNESKEEKKLA